MTADELLKGKRILVLEDDFYLASDEKTLLENAGATVVGPFGSSCVPDHVKAAGVLDAAVVDINLGAGPTYEFARLLREQGTPFVFVTGYDAAAIAPEFKDTPRIEKPLHDRELITSLARLLNSETRPALNRVAGARGHRGAR